MVSVYARNGANGVPDPLGSRSPTLLERKRIQWAKDKAEAGNEWFPFGRPGAGAPLRSSTRRSSSQNRLPSQAQQTNGQVQPLSPRSISSPGSSPTNRLQPLQPRPQTFPAQFQQAQSSSPQWQQPLPYGNTMPPVAYGQQYPIPIPPVQPQEAYHAVPSNQMPYYHSIMVNADNGQPMPYGCPNPPILQVQQGSGGNMYQGAHGQQGHKNLSAAPASSPENLCSVPHSTYPLTFPAVSVGYQNGATPLPVSGQVATQPPTSLSYTEQWANQLPYWEPGAPSDVGVSVSSPTALPQVISQTGSNRSQYGGSISTIALDPVTPSRSMGNLVPPQTAWVTPQPQRTAVVNPLNQSYATLAPPTSLPLDQSMDGPLAGKLIHSPVGTPSGFIDGAHNSMLGTSQQLYTPVQQRSFDSLSTGTGPIGQRRRRITSPGDEEDEWEKQEKNMEQKMVLDEQVAEKQRERFFQEQREKVEIERAEAERKRIELRETLESEAERNKWKELWDTEQKREQLIMDAWKKAEEEAKLLKQAKLMHHARAAHAEPNSVPSSLVQQSSRSRYTGDSSILEDENLSQVSRSIDALERAREEAEMLLKRERLKKELQRQDILRERQQQQGSEPAAGPGSRSRSVPPKATSVCSPYEERPIRPAQYDPLELWEKLTHGKEYCQTDENDSSPRRSTPVRQSLRTPKTSKVAAARKSRRADSLERLAKKSEDEREPEESAPPQRPPRTRKKAQAPSENTDGPEPKSKPSVGSGTYVIDDSVKEKTPSEHKDRKVKDRSKSPVPRRRPSPSSKKQSAIENKPPPAEQGSHKHSKSKSSNKESKTPTASEHSDKSKKLLARRPSIEQMLYPTSEKATGVACSSDSDAASSQQVRSSRKDENPWGDTLGGLNPLLQPLSTRHRSRKKAEQVTSEVPEKPPRSPTTKKHSSDSYSQSAGELSSPTSKELSSSGSHGAAAKFDKKPPSGASIDSSKMASSYHPLLKDKNLTTKDTNHKKPVFSATGQPTPSVRVDKEEKDEEWSRPFVRGGRRASMDSFNTRSPLYSSISSKRGQPTERQQKILDQLASLRQQLKSKQKQVENSLLSERSPRNGLSRSSLIDHRNPSADC